MAARSVRWKQVRGGSQVRGRYRLGWLLSRAMPVSGKCSSWRQGAIICAERVGVAGAVRGNAWAGHLRWFRAVERFRGFGWEMGVRQYTCGPRAGGGLAAAVGGGRGRDGRSGRFRSGGFRDGVEGAGAGVARWFRCTRPGRW